MEWFNAQLRRGFGRRIIVRSLLADSLLFLNQCFDYKNQSHFVAFQTTDAKTLNFQSLCLIWSLSCWIKSFAKAKFSDLTKICCACWSPEKDETSLLILCSIVQTFIYESQVYLLGFCLITQFRNVLLKAAWDFNIPMLI